MHVEYTVFKPIFGAQDSYIYILTLILFLLSVIVFIKNKFDVLNPSFIYSICLTGCCALAAIYTPVLDLPMHFNTAVIILIMSMLFLGGGVVAEYVQYQQSEVLKERATDVQGLHISWFVWVFFLVILVSFAYLNYMDFLAAAQQVTNETEFTKMLRPVVEGIAHQEIAFDRWNASRRRFAECMGYISVLAVWLNLMTNQYKEAAKWGCLVLLYIPFMILTGGRQLFMYLIIFSMVSCFLVYRKKHRGEGSLRKELTGIGIAIAVFSFCFLGLGVINGKIGANASCLKVLVHYAGTNISAFDVFINEMCIPDNPYIGSTTLTNIYRFLYACGVNIPPFSQYNTTFTVFSSVSTNVYTAFYRYINDFGYFGCGLVTFLIGFFYTYMYKKMYQYGLPIWTILIYASIVFPIFLMGREERFLNEVFNTSNFSFIIVLLVLYKFFWFLNGRRSQER